MLIHPGYSKCASTWFQEVLRSSKEEVQFKAPSNPPTFVRDNGVEVMTDEHLLSLAQGVELSEYSELSFVNFFKTIRGFRAVIFIRPPEDMIKSRYAQYVKQGGNISRDSWVAEFAGDDTYLKYNDFRYANHFRAISSFFDLKDILVVSSKYLRAKPAEALRIISVFGELPEPLEDRRVRSNKSPSDGALNALIALNRLFVIERRRVGHHTRTHGGLLGLALYQLCTRTVFAIDIIRRRFAGVENGSSTPTSLSKAVRSAFEEDEDLIKSFKIGSAHEYLQKSSG